MHVRLSASAVVVALSFAAGACDDNNRAAELKAGLVGPSTLRTRLLSVEPSALSPEFLAGPSCRGFRPFRTRFNLFVHVDRDLFLRGVRFDFRDRFDGRAHPLPIPTTVTGPTTPNAVPLALPSSVPIPIPGTLMFNGVMVSPGIRALGFLLNFECGVPPDGRLSISVETVDAEGTADISEVSVPIG